MTWALVMDHYVEEAGKRLEPPRIHRSVGGRSEGVCGATARRPRGWRAGCRVMAGLALLTQPDGHDATSGD